MKLHAILLMSLATVAAPSAFARESGEECWNPRAHHFESVRPGERQNDLDFRYCRPKLIGGGRPSWHRQERECWNPHARHFERVRPGERQDDLDFGRCRPISYYSQHGGSNHNNNHNGRPRECWNPRAGHYEGVRPGERQDDLDFSRCRPRRY